MSDRPCSACILSGLEPARTADVIRAAAGSIGLCAVAADEGPARGLSPEVPAFELTCADSRAPHSLTAESTMQLHGPPETAVALCAAMSAETGGFVLSDTLGAWYAGHPVAFEPRAGGPSLSELACRLSDAPDLGVRHGVAPHERWTLLGAPTMPAAAGPLACAVSPWTSADEFADAWARESAADTDGWAWTALLAPPADASFILLRRAGRADPERIDRLARSLSGIPAAAFELIDGRGTTWWFSPAHPRVTEPLPGVAALIDLLGNAALLMGSSAAAIAWPAHDLR